MSRHPTTISISVIIVRLLLEVNMVYRRLTSEQRIQIVTLHGEGITITALSARFNVRRATISDLLAKHAQYGTVADLPRRGRPRASTQRQDRALGRLSVGNPGHVSRRLAQEWREVSNVNVTPRSVRYRLVSMGLHGQIACKRPLLTAAHKARRLQWARERVNWTVAQWRQVIFSDEVPLHLVQTTARRYIRCRRGGRSTSPIYQPRLHSGGGSIMVWGAFRGDRVIGLHRVQGRLNGAAYINILQEHVEPFFPDPNITFQHDNAPCHTSRLVERYLEDHQMNTMPWPACSPDLNPIEHVWSHLKRELDQRQIHGIPELFETANDIFHNLPAGFLSNLLESMPRRCAAVIAKHGGSTNY